MSLQSNSSKDINFLLSGFSSALESASVSTVPIEIWVIKDLLFKCLPVLSDEELVLKAPMTFQRELCVKLRFDLYFGSSLLFSKITNQFISILRKSKILEYFSQQKHLIAVLMKIIVFIAWKHDLFYYFKIFKKSSNFFWLPLSELF